MTNKPNKFQKYQIYGAGLAAVFLLTVVFFSEKGIDVKKNAEVVESLRQLRQLDANFRQGVLKLRFGFLLDYDTVATSISQSQAELTDLERGPNSIYHKGDPNVDQKIEALKKIFEKESQKIEVFSSENATLNNSLKFFPTLISEFTDRAALINQTRLVELTDRLLSHMLIFSFTDRGETSALEIRILLGQMKSMGLPEALGADFKLIASHSEIILSKKDEMDGLMKDLLSPLASLTIDELARAYYAYHENQVKTGTYYRIGFYLLCLLLIGFITRVVAELKNKSIALDEANKFLDQRVKERTQELLESQKELKERESRLSTIYNFSPLGIFLADRQGEYRYMNPAYQKISGLAGEEAIGRGWEESIYLEDRERVTEEWALAIRDHASYESSYRFMHRDQTILWAQVAASPILENNQVLGYVGIVEDVTEKKKLTEQLLQSQKMETVGSLAGGIAHDLNNQLTPLSGYLDLILRQLNSEDANYPLIEEVNRATNRCAGIVQKLVNFSRPSSKTKSSVRVQEFLKEIEHLLPKFLPAIIETEIHCDENVHEIWGNETELHTVLMNFAANARDAMPGGGRLKIEAKNTLQPHMNKEGRDETKSYVVLSIQDTGQGIPPAIIKRIFEPFFSTKEKSKGTGLGLAMVFNIVKDHEGWVTVSSQVGEGTCFQIYLPANLDGSKKSEKTQKQNMLGLQKGTETVLFVDDEVALRNLGKLSLERLGYTVLLACDGQEAIEIYKKEHPKVAAIVLDMTMPKMSGKDTIAGLLKVSAQAKIILVTGFTAEGTSEELVQAGAKDVIQKPYTIFSISQKMRSLIEN